MHNEILESKWLNSVKVFANKGIKVLKISISDRPWTNRAVQCPDSGLSL